MGAAGACNIIFRKEIASAKDQEGKRKELVDGYVEKFANPYIAASKGFIDAVIHPQETRSALIAGLQANKNKVKPKISRKHGNIPL
jgi:propionyl-CoA carboxylase beta chain